MSFHQAWIIRLATKSQIAPHQSFGLLSIGPLFFATQMIDQNGVAINPIPNIATIIGGPRIRPATKYT